MTGHNLYAASTSLYPYAVPFDDEGNRIDYPGGDDKVKTIVNEWNYSENERRMFRAIGSLYAQLNLGEIFSPLKGLRYRFILVPTFVVTVMEVLQMRTLSVVREPIVPV